MNRKIIVGAIAAGLFIAAGAYWLVSKDDDKSHLTLHGNVDIRQVSLAFENSGRIHSMSVDEGDHVKAGQVVATLDTEALKIQEQQAIAQLDIQKQSVREQQTGARPEELAQARAQLSSAQAQLQKATDDISRIQHISASTGGKGISKQELDTARSNLRIAQASVKERQASLVLMEKGVRSEQREASAAQVRARLQEPGDMTSAQKSVFTLALSAPKWVRVWLNESDLGRVKTGMPAEIMTDSFPDKPVKGKVGFISSVAEFTPKSVQTEALRTNLVYEVRVIVDDPDNVLRMGQPATVTVNTEIGTKNERSN